MNNSLMDKMFKPEFRFLIDREDGEILPLIDSHLFTTFAMVVGLNIALILGLLCALKVGRVGLTLVFKGLTKIWSLLTPGNQWQELFLIGSSIFLGAMLILIMNEILQKLDDSFTKLHTQLKEKDARIVALEEQLSLNWMLQDSAESVESESKLGSVESESESESDESESDESESGSVESGSVESGAYGGTPVELGAYGGTPVKSVESGVNESVELGAYGGPPVESVESDEIKTHINNLLTNYYEYLRRDPMKNHLYNNDE